MEAAKGVDGGVVHILMVAEMCLFKRSRRQSFGFVIGGSISFNFFGLGFCAGRWLVFWAGRSYFLKAKFVYERRDELRSYWSDLK